MRDEEIKVIFCGERITIFYMKMESFIFKEDLINNPFLINKIENVKKILLWWFKCFYLKVKWRSIRNVRK